MNAQADERQFFSDIFKELPHQVAESVHSFFSSYRTAFSSSENFSLHLPMLRTFLEKLRQQLLSPYHFSHYHIKEQEPFDFFHMARMMILPLIDVPHSRVSGIDNIYSIHEALERKENVIFLANHQIEADPQIISLMVEPYSKKLADDMVYVAGHRVTTDPLAAPFSRGCNLICIYSKKYIEHPPELRAEKLQHNARSLACIEELLHEGGLCMYVAPSGGRDRWDNEGNVAIADFDPQSVELFRLLSKKARKPTHLHLLTLSTIHILPPPKQINVELGEQRIASKGPVHLHFSEKIIFDEPSIGSDKIQARQERADMLTKKIKQTYTSFFI